MTRADCDTGFVTLADNAEATMPEPQSSDSVAAYTITITNGATFLPSPTGVTLTFAPYAAIVAAGAALWVPGLLRRRKEEA